jgi:hypothetical protein
MTYTNIQQFYEYVLSLDKKFVMKISWSFPGFLLKQTLHCIITIVRALTSHARTKTELCHRLFPVPKLFDFLQMWQSPRHVLNSLP